MKITINFCPIGTLSYYRSYYDSDEGAIYFEVKLYSKIKNNLPHINKFVICKKHYYDVEYVGKTAGDAHLFKVIDYYNRWFERNMN